MHTVSFNDRDLTYERILTRAQPDFRATGVGLGLEITGLTWLGLEVCGLMLLCYAAQFNLSKYNFIRTIMNNSPNRTSLIKVYRTRLTNYTKGLFYFIRARESLSGDLNMRKIKIEKETILQNFQGQRIFIFYRFLLY